MQKYKKKFKTNAFLNRILYKYSDCQIIIFFHYYKHGSNYRLDIGYQKYEFIRKLLRSKNTLINELTIKRKSLRDN